MVIFHSHVSLPEGRRFVVAQCCNILRKMDPPHLSTRLPSKKADPAPSHHHFYRWYVETIPRKMGGLWHCFNHITTLAYIMVISNQIML